MIQANDLCRPLCIGRTNKKYFQLLCLILVELFREAISLKWQDEKMFQKIGHQIQEMAKNSAKLSNKALIQKENFIGKKHKSFTYLVDEKTLTKKKKQPKCLRDQSHEKIDLTSQIGIEYFFRKVCQKGSFFREETANPPRCGFYHHFDPYLKVSIISFSGFCNSSHAIPMQRPFFVTKIIIP